MTTASLNDYGQVGEAQYDTERQEWVFTRSPCVSRRLQLLDGPVYTWRSGSKQDPLHTYRSARSRVQSTRDLTSTFPELAAAKGALPSLVLSSESIEKVHGPHDPLESDRLAFGSLRDIDRSASSSKGLPVVAIPGGVSRDKVIFVRLNQEKLEWEGQKDLCVNSTTLRGGEHTIWQDAWGPIKQLLFSPVARGHHQWLAVRFYRATVLLQPVYRRNERYWGSGAEFKQSLVVQGSSQIDPNKLLVLPIDSTGGSPHSDVAFSSFDADRLAVVDQRGCWSIWRFKKNLLHKDFWGLRLVVSGRIDATQRDGGHTADALNDGWGRINWICDSSTIFIASRTSFALIDTKLGVTLLVVHNIVAPENADFILDIKKDLSDGKHVYVVTTTRILCLEICPRNHSKGKALRPSARILLSCRHFRSTEDTSLKLSIARNGDSIIVILYSRTTRLSTVHTLLASPSAPTIPPCILSPYVLDLGDIKESDTFPPRPVDLSRTNQHKLASLALRELRYDSNEASGPGSSVARFTDSGARIYQLTVLENDFSVSEYLLIDHPELLRGPPDIRSLVPRSMSFAKVASGRFFVSAMEDSDSQYENFRTNTRKGPETSPTGPKKGVDFVRDSWTLDMGWLQRYTQRVRERNERGFHEALELIQSSVDEDVGEMRLAARSLLELSDSKTLDWELIINDVDAASNALKFALRAFDPASISQEDGGADKSPYIVSNTPMNMFCHSIGIGDLFEMSKLYDYIVRSWISPMPSHSPGRVRILTENLARKAAAHICFAWSRIDLSNFKYNIDLDEHDENPRQGLLKMPLRHRRSAIMSSQGIEQGAGQTSQNLELIGIADAAESPRHTLPTPESTPSLRSKSSISSIAAAESLASQRFRARGVLMSSRTDSDAALSSLMRHWNENEDPQYYDWEAAERTTALEYGNIEIDEESEKRRKHRVDKERRKLRERTDRPVQSVGIEVKSSQPHEGFGTQETTQASGPVIVSQDESGMHGSRKSSAKKPQKRKAGF